MELFLETKKDIFEFDDTRHALKDGFISSHSIAVLMKCHLGLHLGVIS
jgi:hypothetical protein